MIGHHGRLAVLLAIILLGSGCTQSRSLELKSEQFRAMDYVPPSYEGYHWPDPVYTDSTGVVVEAARFGAPPGGLPSLVMVPVPRRLTCDSGLPGVCATLAPNLARFGENGLLVTSGDDTLVSADAGRTWSLLQRHEGPHVAGSPNPLGADYFVSQQSGLATDMASKQIWVGHLNEFAGINVIVPFVPFNPDQTLCTASHSSADAGASWTTPGLTNWPASCHPRGSQYAVGRSLFAPPGPTANEAVDPFRAVAGPTVPPVLYSCAGACAVSRDAGASFENRAGIPCAGKPAAFRDGTLVASAACRGQRPGVVLSSDNGRTWQKREYSGGESWNSTEVSISSNGVAFLAYEDSNGTSLLRSRDRFQTWEGPFQVSPPNVRNLHLSAVAVGDDDRVAVAYVAPTGPAGPRHRTDWHLMVTLTATGNQSKPLFVTQQVTPTERPLMVGTFQVFGSFIDTVIDADGRLHLALLDACTFRTDCPANLDAVGGAWGRSRDTQVSVATVDHGWGMLSSKDPLPGLGLEWPDPYDTRVRNGQG